MGGIKIKIKESAERVAAKVIAEQRGIFECDQDGDIEVKNVSGTARRQCKCRGWIQHWCNGTNSVPDKCSVVNCGSSDGELHGAHVTIEGGDKREYIVPLCSKHNNPGNMDAMELRGGSKLVSANQEDTCAGPWLKKSAFFSFTR